MRGRTMGWVGLAGMLVLLGVGTGPLMAQPKNPKLVVTLPGPKPLTEAEKAKLAFSLSGATSQPKLGATVALTVGAPKVGDKALALELGTAAVSTDSLGRKYATMTSGDVLTVTINDTTKSTTYLIDCPVGGAAVVDWLKFDGGPKLKPGGTLYSQTLGSGNHLTLTITRVDPPGPVSLRLQPKFTGKFDLYECDVTPFL